MHRRSPEKLIARLIRGLIFANSFRDRVLCETVSLLSRRDILAMLSDRAVKVSLVPDVERGEVLIDARGCGSFQKAKPKPKILVR